MNSMTILIGDTLKMKKISLFIQLKLVTVSQSPTMCIRYTRLVTSPQRYLLSSRIPTDPTELEDERRNGFIYLLVSHYLFIFLPKTSKINISYFTFILSSICIYYSKTSLYLASAFANI